METNINYAAVGAFMITLIAAIVLAIIWLSSGFNFQQYTTYKIYMQEAVSGLNIDSPVEFNGVNVGNVKSIELDQTDPQHVELLISVKDQTPVSQGTIATLQSRGITGVTYISLRDKSDTYVPIEIQKGDKYPVIRTGPSIFLRIDTALSKLSDNLHDVSTAFQQLLDKENQRNIKDILANMERITGTLADNNVRMTRILDNTEKASNQFGPLVRSTTNTMRMFELQTMPATYQLIANLNGLTRSLTEMSAELKQNPSIVLRGVQRTPNGPGESQ